MKNVFLMLFTLISAVVFGQEVPKVLKTTFSDEALSQKIVSLNGKKLPIKEVLEKHKNQILIIDFWASWCKDCIQALPKTKELVEKNPQVQFVYFSLDRSEEQWKKGLEKFGLQEKENYWFDEGWKNAFNNYVDLNWIPRFIIVDRNGEIAKYYAITPDDPEVQKTIDSLK